MGKPKRNKKQAKDDSDSAPDLDPLAAQQSDGSEEEETIQTQPKQKSKKAKKKKGKKQPDTDDDDMPTTTATAFELLGMEDEESDEEENSTQKAGGGFAMLDVDGDEQDDDDDEKDEVQQKTTKKSKSKKKKDKKEKERTVNEEDEIAAALAALEIEGSGKGKKSKKAEKQESVDSKVPETSEQKDDIKEGENSDGAKELEAMGESDIDEHMQKKRKKKKAKKEEEPADGEEDGEHTVKTKAEKKKEKKDKKKKKEQKATTVDQADVEGGVEEKSQEKEELSGEEDSKAKKKKEKRKKKKAAAEAAEEAGAIETVEKMEAVDHKDEKESGDEDESKSKKKKKKKKEKGEEKEEKKKGKPGKAALAAMKEQLAKIKEDEERRKREEEERIRLEEEKEAERLRKKEEEERRRQIRLQKEKEKRARLKAEGKLLNAKQKADKLRAQQMLEAMGISRPDPAEAAKRPKYGKYNKRRPQTKSEEKSPEPEQVEEEPVAKVEEVKIEEKTKETAESRDEEDGVEDSWDAEDNVKDSWDAEDDLAKAATEVEKEAEIEDDQESESESESEESSDEESSEESSDESSYESSEESSSDEESQRERALARIAKRKIDNEKARTTDRLRSAVVCVLGHVDTGKTKILDKLRRTHVQDNEAGGITQQIGATNVPQSAIRDQTKFIKSFQNFDLRLPGLLIIDTPGHESFSNLRTRGSSLCDLAILVVDIMHGLEPQTIESINLLKKKKCPFVVALNKIDRLFEFKSNPRQSVEQTIAEQTHNTQIEFKERVNVVFGQMAEQGLNVALFYENQNEREYISMVPTSAHSGDGMGDLMSYICTLSQNRLAPRLAFSNELQAIVMEVKALPGLGTTIDVILVNGRMRIGETVVVAGTEGPIVTTIRDILTPQPMKELRVKAQYQHYKEIEAAQGVKLIAKDFENVLAGLPLLVANHSDEVAILQEEIGATIKEALSSFKVEERGVYVQASTLGSLEALLEFLSTSKIPYAGINIGPVHKKDVVKASVMLEHDSSMAVILAFDVKVERDAQEMADAAGVKIFSADIIYHLFDRFMAFVDEVRESNKEKYKHVAVFPCKLRILPNCVFNSRDPIVVGVVVEDGIIRPGTPLCVPSKEMVMIGRIASIEFNHKVIDKAVKGNEVCVKIEPMGGEAPKLVGRHFEVTDLIVSKISRESIDALKQYFKDEMTKPDWKLVIELKKVFRII